MGTFSDKVAIVTGGASGIGRALSEQMAERGATVVMADRNEELLSRAAESISGDGYSVSAAALDVTDYRAVKDLVDETAREYGRIDYMYNNAGISVAGYTHELTCEDLRNVIDVDLFGVVHGVRAAYPVMVKQGSGHIVNTASLAGLIPIPLEIGYTTSKYGIVGLSHALRIEAKDHGVKVSVVCPGFIDTPIYQTSKVVGFDREKGIELLPKGVSAEKCAQVILRGVERNRATIPVTPLAHLSWLLQRISPGLMRVVIKKLANRVAAARIEG